MASKTRTEAVRDAYAAHFGPLFDSDASLHGNYQVLRFWARRPPIVYATLGARPAEVTITSIVPFPEFKEAVSELAVGTRKLAPLEILPYRVERTPFEGVLILPPEDGTLVVPTPGKKRVHAYRAVPLTASELGLGLDAPERLLHLLREAGALIADPTRDCVLEPDQTRRFWRTARPQILSRERRRLRASRVRLSFFHESGAPALYSDLEERLISVREALIEHIERTGTPDDLAAARALCVETIFPDLADIGTKPFLAFLDPPTLDAIRLFLALVVLTHPDAPPRRSRALD
ncbi:MAG TPA: hypothetical protein VLS89_12800, partial [Candidatus Nanopelagicales bacterium]|nr:hypothetical protein [Candidatus Nanopelagicales bacterium]